MRDEEQLEKALADIEEWFEEALCEVSENLAPGASAATLSDAEARLGAPLPDPLRSLYAWHDGQRSLDEWPLFEWLSFLPLKAALGVERDAMLGRYFGVWRPGDAIDAAYVTQNVLGEARAEELDGRWLPFASEGGDVLAVHLLTGRVLRCMKGESPVGRVVAEDLEAFLCEYADGLWRGEYQVMGDPEVLGERMDEEGQLSLKGYVLCRRGFRG